MSTECNLFDALNNVFLYISAHNLFGFKSSRRWFKVTITMGMDLKSQIINELHRPARTHFPRRATVVKGIDDAYYQADLLQMSEYKRENKGYAFILTIINCFSKVAMAIPLKNKTSIEVANAMKNVLKVAKIRLLQTDDGGEFFNKTMRKLLEVHGVRHYSSKSEVKCAIIERFNRSLRLLIHKQFSLQGNHVWYNILEKLLKIYNNRKHRTIGMPPVKVSKNNEKLVLQRIRIATKPKPEKRPPQVFKVGDKVRVSRSRMTFHKSYYPMWSNETFTINRVQPTEPKTYLLMDTNGELIQGGFYGHELSKSKVGDVFLVQKVLKKKGNKLLVRWLGFSSSQDSWIDKKDLI